MKKRFLFALTAMMIAGTLSACGSDNNSTSSQDIGSSSQTSSKIDEIKEKGEIVMLTNATFPPFAYIEDDGSVQGVDVDIAQAFAQKLGVELKVVDMDFPAIISSLASGKGDFAAGGMTVTEERLKQVNFSDEYVTSSQVVIVRDGSDIDGQTKEELDKALSGKNIAVQEGTTGDFYASGDEEMTGSQIKDANVLQYKSATEAGMYLAQGKADAVIIDEKPAQAVVEANNGKLKILDTKLTDEQYAFAIKKEDEDLLEVINEVINEYKGDKVDELVKKHMGV